MGFLSRLGDFVFEKRSSLENPQTPLSYPSEWLLDLFNGGRTDSGIRVSELTAFQSSTFYSCVDLIAGAVASLPINVVERVPKGNRVVNNIAYDHYLYDLVHFEPNPDMSRFTFLKAYVAHMLAWGNGYAELQRDGGNKILGMWLRNPAKTRPHVMTKNVVLEPVDWRPFPVTLEAGDMVYVTTDGIESNDGSNSDASSGKRRIIPAEDMLHVPGLALDGRIGQSPVWLARQTLGMALALDKFGAKYFANFAKPGGILTMPAQMSPEAKEKAKQSWLEAQGGENAHRVAVLPAGWEFKPMSHNPQEAQSTQSKEAIRNEIASIMHVPPHMVGDTRGRTSSGTEQMSTEFTQYTLGQWLVAIKLEWKRKLFPNPDFAGVGRRPQRNNYFVEFDLSKMLRPDAASREKFISTMFTTGAFSPNDIREYEGQNPREDDAGDTYYIPVNMQDANNPVVTPDDPQQPNDPNKKKPEPEPEPEPGPQQPEAKSLIPAYSRLFNDAFGRYSARSKQDLESFEKAFTPVLLAMTDAFYQLHDKEFRHGTNPPSDVVRFVKDVVGGMHRRAATFDAAAELERVVVALDGKIKRDVQIQLEKRSKHE